MDSSPPDRSVLAATRTGVDHRTPPTGLSTVDIVVPVCRDDPELPKRVRALYDVVHDCVPLSWSITIVDVGGADDAWSWAAHLAEQLPGVHAARARPGGRGAALKAALRHTRAQIVVLLELDLPSALDALLPLVAPLVSGRADVSVGSVPAGSGRGIARRAYSGLLRFGFGAGDPRCGLAAARADALWPLLHKIGDDTPVLSTELLLLAKHNGLRVHEVPIDPDTLPDTGLGGQRPGWSHIKMLIQLTHAMVTGRADIDRLPGRPANASSFPAVVLMKFTLFGIVGALSGVLYVLVYLPFREVSSPAVANFAALIAAALFNIEANRAWTFRKARVARLGMHVRSAILFVAHYVLTTGAVVILLLLDPAASKAAEVITLLAADLLMTVARFVGLEKWVFRRRLAT